MILYKKCSEVIYNTLAYMWCVLIYVIDIYAIIYVGIMNTDFFMKVYSRISIVTEMFNISSKEIERIIDIMLRFVKGSTDNISIAVNISGERTMFFNDREISHMIDLQNKFSTFNQIIVTMLVAEIVILILYIYKNKLLYICRAFLISEVILVFTGIILLVWIKLDTTSFIIAIHQMLFENNLWILNPATDYLALLFPKELFVYSVIYICVYMLVLMLIMSAVAVGFIKKRN